MLGRVSEARPRLCVIVPIGLAQLSHERRSYRSRFTPIYLFPAGP